MANLDGLLAHELAKLLSCNRRSVSRWAKDEGMPKNPDGTFNGPACVAWIVERIEGRLQEVKAEQPQPGGEWLAAFRRERFRIARLERKERQGRLILKEDVIGKWAERVRLVVAGLEVFADRLPGALVGKPREAMAQIISDEVRQLRLGFAQEGEYCPAPFDTDEAAAAIRGVFDRLKPAVLATEGAGHEGDQAES